MTHAPETEIGSLLRRAASDLAASRYREAHAACLEVLQIEPHAAEAYYLLAVLTAQHDNHAKALELFDRAVALDAAKGAYHADRARSLLALSRQNEAVAAVEIAETCPHLSARTLDTIGVVLSRAGLHDRAVTFYEQATAIDAGCSAYWYNLAAAVQFVGDFDRARAAYGRAIELEPDHARAWSAQVLMTRQSAADNHIAELEALFNRLSDADERMHIGHAIAKTHEDLDDLDSAMTWLERAKFDKRQQAVYDRETSHQTFAAAADASRQLDSMLKAGKAGDTASDEDDAPIFIVGLPRTGTTLIDRILSSHSRIVSAGELSDFALEIKRAAATPSRFVLDPETLARAPQTDLIEAGRRYMVRARRSVGDTPRFIDKMPLNVFYAPLILAALPRARVICVRRHPADTVLSNYRQLFATGFSYYHYALDLAWAADYYAQFDRLVAAYREHLPDDRFTEAAYEDVVANLEGQARRLVTFCGEAWEPGCLNFHANTAPVATASSSQVRQPLYSSSVGRWKRVAAKMAPALNVLTDAGVEWRQT